MQQLGQKVLDAHINDRWRASHAFYDLHTHKHDAKATVCLAPWVCVYDVSITIHSIKSLSFNTSTLAYYIWLFTFVSVSWQYVL